MGIFKSSEPTGGWFGPKREIHRGTTGRNNPEGKGKRGKASKAGHGTRKVKGLLKSDAKARKLFGETRDSRGGRAIRGKGGAADGLDRRG